MTKYEYINYDDWVYMGKEVYGSRNVSGPAKFSTRFFDALGRAYDKMKANIKYYVFKDATENKHKVALEFEVYMRVIKDSDGNDVRVFVKEDKANGFRKDSSFYWNGSWEVLEKNDVTRTIKSRTSLGVKAITEYDVAWRINKYYLIDNRNDTITMEQYIWKNGRLAKMIQNGLERIYIYGKTLRDTVKVIPSDEGMYFHPGYNNSIGKIPNEDDPMYEYFAMDPYGGIYISNDKNNKSFLSKLNSYQYPIAELDVPSPKFVNPSRNSCKLPICPEKDNISGFVKFGNLLLSKDSTTIWASCVMDINFCNYRISYSTYVEVLQFEILQSILIYNINKRKYDRWCRTKREIQDTYNHERQHILNAREYANEIVNEHIPKKFFYSKNGCELFKKEAEDIIFEKFTTWKRKEYEHSNPNSPQQTGKKEGELCDVE